MLFFNMDSVKNIVLHLTRMFHIDLPSHVLALEPRFSDSEHNLNANACVAGENLRSRKYTGYVIGTVKAEEQERSLISLWTRARFFELRDDLDFQSSLSGQLASESARERYRIVWTNKVCNRNRRLYDYLQIYLEIYKLCPRG